MKKLMLFLLICLLATAGRASHLVGGDFSLRHLSGDKYELTLKVFRDCENGIPWFNDPLTVGVFEKGSNRRVSSFEMKLLSNDTLNFSSKGCIRIPTGCTHIGTYRIDINLPATQYNNVGGYYFSWERCCRNTIIKNIVVGTQPGITGMTYYMEVPNVSVINSTPIFKRDPLTLLCVDNPFTFNYDCYDADGDSLVYSLVTPLKGTASSQNSNDPNDPNYPMLNPGPYENAHFQRGYGIFTNIMDASPKLIINAHTGELSVTPKRQGVYAIAIKVEEYRNHMKIGEVRRELQLNVSSCLQNSAPTFNPEAFDKTYVVNASDTLCFPVNINDRNGDSITFTATGSLLSGDSATHQSAAIISEGSGKVNFGTNFCWYTKCYSGVPDTFEVDLKARDNGCPINKSTISHLKIVLLPQPTPAPPGIFCLQRINADVLKLNIGGIPNTRYLDYYIALRYNPNGSIKILDTLRAKNFPDHVTDSAAYDHAHNFYRYFIVGRNKCGLWGDSSYEVNTNPAIPKNPKTTYLISASVERINRGVRLSWAPSQEGNFDSYTIQRKENTPSDQFVNLLIFKNRNDTAFLDSSAKVSAVSYCYRIIVGNRCGYFSDYSNSACTILLKGKADPFVNNISWNEYKTYQSGVGSYVIQRRTPFDASFTDRGVNSLVALNYSDNDLDIDYGLYYYRVGAVEAAGKGSHQAVSYSNEIKLVQLPRITVPNAFTPNSDGLNDSMNTFPVFVKDYSLKVFNRWGEKVFETNDKHEEWDGRYRGNGAFDNVFIWQCTYTGWDNSTNYKWGNITTLR